MMIVSPKPAPPAHQPPRATHRSAFGAEHVYSANCRKRAYPNALEAFAEFLDARLIKGEWKGNRTKAEVGAYRCDTCRMIHLTSMPLSRTPQALMANRLW